jgi:peptidyl-prolyl cis-trans isomerase SurA
MIFKTVSRLTICLLCLHAWQSPFAQGIRLTPTPALSIRAPNADGSNAAVPAVVQADFIVAIVNSEPITNNEVKTRLIRYERRLAEQGAALPSRIDLAREVLEDIIREKLQLKLAKETGIRVDDRTVDAAVQNFATQNNLSLAELKARTSADGIGYTQIRADIQNQLLIQKLRERDVLGGIAISNNDIEVFIKEQLSANPSAELTIDLAQILIAIPEGASPAQVQALQNRADRLFARAKAGEDFYKLAQENSDARDARAGGQMGLRAADRYPTLFTEATKDLKVGEITGPVRSGAGFHLLKLLEKQLPNNNSFVITQTHPRHILLRTGATMAESAAKNKLSELKKRIESNAIDFATAAKETSQDGSAAAGGDLGWASPGQFVPEFESVMDQLTIGKISDPIVTRFGVHLLLVEERRQSQLSALEQRDVARNALREKKFDDAYANWMRELRGNAYVEYRDIQPN